MATTIVLGRPGGPSSGTAFGIGTEYSTRRCTCGCERVSLQAATDRASLRCAVLSLSPLPPPQLPLTDPAQHNTHLSAAPLRHRSGAVWNTSSTCERTHHSPPFLSPSAGQSDPSSFEAPTSRSAFTVSVSVAYRLRNNDCGSPFASPHLDPHLLLTSRWKTTTSSKHPISPRRLSAEGSPVSGCPKIVVGVGKHPSLVFASTTHHFTFATDTNRSHNHVTFQTSQVGPRL